MAKGLDGRYLDGTTEDGGKWLNGGGSSIFSQRVVEAMVADATYEFSVLVRSAGSSYAVSRIFFSREMPGTHAPVQRLPPTVVNGREVTELPFDQALPTDQPNWLIDTQQTGYYLPPGQTVHVARRHQKSRDGHDEPDTEGHYASAWIAHGVNPGDAGYEYAVVVRATPERLAAFAASPPYHVARKDASAHLVWDQRTNTWGCVFFEAQTVAPTSRPATAAELLVQTLDRPCLVMQETLDSDRIHLSLGDPDLNLKDGLSQPRTLTVALRGTWQPVELPEDLSRRREGEADAAIEVSCKEGASYGLELKRGS